MEPTAVSRSTLRLLANLLFASLLLASWRLGGSSSARAQVQGTTTPVSKSGLATAIGYLPELEIVLPPEIKQAVEQTLLNRTGWQLPGDLLTITGIRQEESWGMITVSSSEPAREALAAGMTEYALLQPGKTAAILFVKKPTGWAAAFAETQGFVDLLQWVPLSELNEQARAAFLPRDQASGVATNLLFPWRQGETWRLTNGWHSGYGSSLDFAPYGASTREVLSVTDATVIGMCGPDALQVQVRTRGPAGDWYYLHLDKNQPYPTIGATTPQGSVIGKIFSTGGSFSSDCGYGTGPHVHLTAPSQSFTMDGWTVNSSNVWTKPGYANRTVGDTFASTNYTVSQIFSDVPTPGKEWMEPWINAFYDRGITSGCGTGPLIYCPENDVTRAEMAVFLLRAKHGAGYSPPAASHYFADVPVTGKEWMEPWIDQYYREGMTTGCGGGNYCPENNVTRAEMAVFVLRALHGGGYGPPAASGDFLDVPVAGKEWMEPWIIQFRNEGITSGCGGGNYCPENNVTRAEMAVFVGRAYQF